MEFANPKKMAQLAKVSLKYLKVANAELCYQNHDVTGEN